MIIRQISFRESLFNFTFAVLALTVIFIMLIGALAIEICQLFYEGVCYISGFSLRRNEEKTIWTLMPFALWSAILGVFLVACLIAGIFWKAAFYLAPIGILISAIGSFPKRSEINYQYRMKKTTDNSRQIIQS